MMIDFNAALLETSGGAISLGMVVLTGLALLCAVIATLGIVAIARARRHRQAAAEAAAKSEQIEGRFNELSGRLQTMIETTVTSQTELARALHERFDRMGQNVGQNLSNSALQTSESLSKITERLTIIDKAQKNLDELSTQVVGLQDILANKQARGAFGQSRMEAIIADGLPKSAYRFQPTLSNKTRPDCMVMLPDIAAGIVIDAKFPLEAFRDLPAAGSLTRDQTARVRQDISKHIKDIADKYLIPGETQDLALMFVPSEAIYAQLHEQFEELINKAYQARIVIVSPNMLMLAVHTMQAILKDARMREQAGVIQQEIGHMIRDVHRLRERVLDLQKHFDIAGRDIEKILISSDKISRRGLKIEAVELDEDDVPDLPKPRSPRLAAGE